MAKYHVEVFWSGYSRGVSHYTVEALSEIDAMDNYWDGERTMHEVVRNDTEGEAETATLIEEKGDI